MPASVIFFFVFSNFVLTNRLPFGIITVAGFPAGVAQPVEQLICNQQVGGSNPSTSSTVAFGGGCHKKRFFLSSGPFSDRSPAKRVRLEEEEQRREQAFGLGRKRDDPELVTTIWGCSRVAKGDRL